MYASSEILNHINNDYRDEGNRLKSLRPWFIRGVDAKTLARAGFYYLGEKDHVKCNFCEVQIGGWSRGDNPFIEHMKHSPNCPFLNEDLVFNVPIPNTKHLFLEELALLRNSSENNVRNSKLEKLSVKRIAATARHPIYADGNERLKSFSDWPPALKQTPQEMSDAGFFYLGVGDEVKCFYCGGCLRKFKSTDHALYEHKKHYFNRCKFVQFTWKNLKSQTFKMENSRSIEPTNEQIQHLIEFIEKNECLQSGSISQDNSSIIMWIELTESLNCLNGAIKDVNGWQEVWRNHESYQKRKNSLADEHMMDKTSKRFKHNDDVEVKNETNRFEELGLQIEQNTRSRSSTNMTSENMASQMRFESSNESVRACPSAVDYEKVDETSHTTDLINTELMQIRFKIDQLYIEIEKHKLELDTRLKQLDLVQMQKQFEAQWQEM